MKFIINRSGGNVVSSIIFEDVDSIFFPTDFNIGYVQAEVLTCIIVIHFLSEVFINTAFLILATQMATVLKSMDLESKSETRKYKKVLVKIIE